MADKSIRFWDLATQTPVDVRAYDNGDGTHRLALTTSTGAGKTLVFNGPQGPVPIRVVALGDGTYALMTTGG